MAFSSLRDDLMEDWGGRPEWVERATPPTPSPPRKEPAPVSALTESPIHHDHPPPGTCECGCGKTPRPGRRFASRGCVGKVTAAVMHAKTRELRAAGKLGRKKSSPAPVESALPKQPAGPSTRGERTPGPPPVADLKDPSTWRPGAMIPMSEPAPEPDFILEEAGLRAELTRVRRPPITGLEQAKAYLRKLTPEGRQALLELVAVEERCSALGVV